MDLGVIFNIETLWNILYSFYFSIWGHFEEDFSSKIIAVLKLMVITRYKIMKVTCEGGLRPNNWHARIWKDHTKVFWDNQELERSWATEMSSEQGDKNQREKGRDPGSEMGLWWIVVPWSESQSWGISRRETALEEKSQERHTFTVQPWCVRSVRKTQKHRRGCREIAILGGDSVSVGARKGTFWESLQAKNINLNFSIVAYDLQITK